MSLLSDANLTTWQAVRDALNRDRTDAVAGEGVLSEDTLAPLVERVSAAMEAYCDRRLKAGADDETATLAGDGGATLDLGGRCPIVAVTSVADDGTAIPARPTATGLGWWCTPADRAAGRIRLTGYATTPGAAVTVTGRFGYAADAEALLEAGTLTLDEAKTHLRALAVLEQACLDWCVYLVQHFAPSAQTIELGGMGMTFTERRVPTRVEALLRPFRRLEVH